MPNPEPFQQVDVLRSSRPVLPLVPVWWLGNLMAWLGGASFRGIGNRHERSLYQMSGFFVLLNGAIAWGLFTLAVLGIEEGSTFEDVVPRTIVWGLFVAAFDRAISAKVVDPTHPKSRTITGYAVRGLCAVLLGFVVAEGGALYIFREDIERTMNDNIAGQVSNSRKLIVGTPDRPSERVRTLDAMKATRKKLDDDVFATEKAFLEADQLVLCERQPESCPPDIRDSGAVTGDSGEGPQTRARELQRESALIARDEARKARDSQAPDLDRAIEQAQTDLDTDLSRAQEAASAANGLPARWRAMIDFTRRDSTASYMHFLIIGVCVLLDLIPLLLKLWRGRTTYDLTVIASRDRRQRELDHQREKHAETLERELSRERIEQGLALDLARVRTDSALKIETERERVRLEKEFDRIHAEADEPAPQPAPEPEPEPTDETGKTEETEETAEARFSAEAPQEARTPEQPEQAVPTSSTYVPPAIEPSKESTTTPSHSNGHSSATNGAAVPAQVWHPVGGDTPDFPANWSAEDRALIGKEFGRRFRALEPLRGADAGAFGRILLAKDLQLPGHQVIIKAVQDAGERRFRKVSKLQQMWQRELEAARFLHHSNIGEILTAGNDFGYLWTASPHYEFGSLARWVQSSMETDPEGYPLKDTFGHIEQLVEALVYAHDNKRTHGDIKPTNVVLKGPRLLLVDWGFSRVTTRLEQDDPGPVGATPLFTAPEVVLSRSYNAELADLYSIGATWYFLLTGRAPYDDVDLEAKPKTIARRIKDGRVGCAYLGSVLPDLPHEVVTIVHALVSPEPKERLLGDTGDSPALQLRKAIEKAEFDTRLARRHTVLVGPRAVATAAGRTTRTHRPTLIESQVVQEDVIDAVVFDDDPTVTIPVRTHLLTGEVPPSSRSADERDPVPQTEFIDETDEESPWKQP